jgi:hypothetical protein
VDRWHASSGFRSEKSRTMGIRIHNPRSLKSRRGDETIEKSKPRAHRSFSISGLGNRRTEFLNTASVEIPIGKVPIRNEKRSALTCIGSRGFESAALDN